MFHVEQTSRKGIHASSGRMQASDSELAGPEDFRLRLPLGGNCADNGLSMHPGFALFIGDHLARSVRGVPCAPPA
jgi:hypothetical protein